MLCKHKVVGSRLTFSTLLSLFHNVNGLARGLNLAFWDIAGRSSERLLISRCKFDSYYPSNYRYVYQLVR